MAEPVPPDPPELVKWAQWTLHYFIQEGATVKGAPVLFGVIAVLACTVGYLVAESRFDDRLATADARLNLATEQVAAYKDKLQGASPDEAAKQIVQLRSQIDDLELQIADRVLTDAVKSYMLSTLGSDGKNVKILNSPSPDAAGLAKQIAGLLPKAGWTVTFTPEKIEGDTPLTQFRGSSIQTSAPAGAKVEGSAWKLGLALACVGIHVVFESNSALADDHIQLLVGERNPNEKIAIHTDDTCRARP